MTTINQGFSGTRRFSSRAGKVLAALALAVAGAACSGGGSTDSGASSPIISYSGPSNWTISGPQGGPFQNRSMDILLQNNSTASIDWSASSIPSFVVLDLTSGTIPANSQTSVHAALDPTLAGSLPVGNSGGLLAFHNDTSPQNDIGINVMLSVSAPGVSILVDPVTNFSSTGPAGGPFTPPSIVYTVTNTGNATLSWQATAGESWIDASPASGQLAPNASVPVTVSIVDASTSTLTQGVYWSYVDFVDSTSNSTLDTRTVQLDVTGGSGQGGWTIFTPSVDTRTVYVSSSLGNDSNNGLTEGSPKRTIAAGKALMRNGFPDWLLLKKGDAWTESIGVWSASGRSLSERMLVSSYGPGTTRPLIKTGTDNGMTVGATTPNHVAFVGLHLWAHTYNGSNGTPNGINWVNGTSNFLVEDCYIQGYCTNIVIQGYPVPLRHNNVTIRRNVIVDAYSTGTANVMGLYCSECDGLTIEENVIDRNGWNDSISGSLPSWFRRNIYIQNGNTNVVLRGNIIAGTDGAQMRSGGIMEDNLFLRSAIALLVGGGVIPEPQGVTCVVRNNVMSDGGDIGTNGPSQGPRGWGILLANITQGTVEQNVIANNTHGHSPIAMQLGFANGAGGVTRGVENTEIQDNIIYAWGGSIQVTGSLAQTVNVHIHDCVAQNSVDAAHLVVHNNSSSTAGVTSASNVFYSSMLSQGTWMQVAGSSMSLDAWKPLVQDLTSVGQQSQFPEPTRTIETYHASIGGSPTFDAFMAAARLQSRDNWRSELSATAVNQYIRAGFGL